MSIIELNGLVHQDSGVFSNNLCKPFDYSDGKDIEIYIKEVLLGTNDLSSASIELEAKVNDWPSEYHFSSKRANILRALNLDGVNRVLELGCGCGSITRYLGERQIKVDAVEGSAARSELAALRCRDLSNVNVICANFNEIEIPDAYYDVVLFIGVTEYAARFWPYQIEEEQAVTKLLGMAKRGLRDQGVVVVAIENRTGMKYVLGAHEDHYSKRYVGIHNYMEKAGIKTYTADEWRRLVQLSGFSAVKYIYPFPDYKVPTVLLSEDYTNEDLYAYCNLEGIKSRDYVLKLNLGEQEPIFWESVSATRTFNAFANSFLIIISNEEDSIKRMCDFDFAHLPNFSRKREYCLITKKEVGENTVVRKRIQDDLDISVDRPIRHNVNNEPYWHGALLSVDWSRSLLSDPWANQFRNYLNEYYAYLKRNKLTIDLLPTNIVVDEQGEYQVFDEEWEVEWELTTEYILFRALFSFSLRHRATMREFSRRHGIHTTRDFIVFGFNNFGIDVRPLIGNFIEQEQMFQNTVSVDTETDVTLTLIDSRICGEDWYTPVYARIYWKSSEQGYVEENSVTMQTNPGHRDFVELCFELPENASNMTHFRFDPCDQRRMDDVGFIDIRNLRLGVKNPLTMAEQVILELETAKAIVENGSLSEVVYCENSNGGIFAVGGDNPEIEFEVNRDGKLETDERYFIRVDMCHLRSAEYNLVRQRFLVEEEILRGRIRHLEYESEEKKRLAREIELMKTSVFWKLGVVARSIFRRSGV